MELRYAVLHHTGVAVPHFDVLIETVPGGLLAAWRSPVWPLHGSTRLTRIADHRPLYLDFEGDLDRGRGHVARVAGGRCDVTCATDVRWVFTLLNGGPTQAIRLDHDGQDGWRSA